MSRNEPAASPLVAERSRSGSLKRPHSMVTTGPPEREEEGGCAKVRKIDSEVVEEGEIPSTSIFHPPNRGSSASPQRPHLMVVTTFETEERRGYEGVKDGETRSEKENSRGRSHKVESDDMEEGEIPTAATLPLAAMSLPEDVEDGEIPAPTSVAPIQVLSKTQPARAELHALTPTPSSGRDSSSTRLIAYAQHPLRAPEVVDVPTPSTFGSAWAPSHNATLSTPITAAKTAHPLLPPRPTMQATFIPRPTQHNASTGNILLLPPNSDAPKPARAGSGTVTATLISAMALSQSTPAPAVPELETLQVERGGAVSYAQEQITKLSVVQTQLGAQRTELVELESLRKEVARLQELSDDEVQKISCLLRAQKVLAEDVRVRDERIEVLDQEVAEVARLRARVQDLEVRAEGADALRRDLAALEPLRGIAADFASSRALVQQLRGETTTLIRQRDTAISELSKAWEDNDKLRGQSLELQTLRAHSQEFAPFRDKVKILVQLAQKLKADHDELRVHCQQQETELHFLRTQDVEVEILRERIAALESGTSRAEKTPEGSTQRNATDQPSSLARGDIDTVLDAVERKTGTLEAAECTSGAMCSRALRAEKKAASLEARLKVLD